MKENRRSKSQKRNARSGTKINSKEKNRIPNLVGVQINKPMRDGERDEAD